MPTGRIPTQRQAVVGSSAPRTTQQRGTPPAPRQQTEDRQTNKLQRDLSKAAAAMRAHPHGDGLYVQKGQAFTAGGIVTIQHGLGRAWRGYEVKNVAGAFSRFIVIPNAPLDLDTRQIRIQSEAACSGDVWVF